MRSENAEAFCQVEAFGPRVGAQFGTCGNDIWMAGNCFALELYPACVFHLMRVLERALGVMAMKFAVPFEHTNWHAIIEQLESKVRKINSD